MSRINDLWTISGLGKARYRSMASTPLLVNERRNHAVVLGVSLRVPPLPSPLRQTRRIPFRNHPGASPRGTAGPWWFWAMDPLPAV